MDSLKVATGGGPIGWFVGLVGRSVSSGGSGGRLVADRVRAVAVVGEARVGSGSGRARVCVFREYVDWLYLSIDMVATALGVF